MAARLNPRHQDAIRARIQGSQLVNLLQNHALKGSDVDPSRLEAAKFLLHKVLGNPPQQVEQTGTVTLQWEK